MKIDIFPLGPLSTNCYLLSDHHDAILIDPGLDVLEALRKKYHISPGFVTAIWLTHSHWDHIAGVKETQEFFDCPVYVHPLDAPNLQNPGSDGLSPFFSVPAVTSHIHLIEEGSTLTVGSHVFKVLHTPGHSPGGVCFYCKEQEILISGDTLFKGTIGKLDLPTGDPSKMWKSLQKIAILPQETKIFPGHGPSTVLEKENWIHKAQQIFGGDS